MRKIKAILNDAGNCLFCGETDRCPGKHDWLELQGKAVTVSEIYDLLPLSEKTLLKRLRHKVYPFGDRIRNDGGGACDYFIYDENGNRIAVIVYAGGRKICMHGIQQ